MNNNIVLNEQEVNNLLDRLISQRKRLIAILEKQVQIHEKMHESWSGTSGDKAYETLKKHEKKYELYLNEINKRIIFLDRVKRAYVNFDNYLKNKVDYKNEV